MIHPPAHHGIPDHGHAHEGHSHGERSHEGHAHGGHAHGERPRPERVHAAVIVASDRSARGEATDRSGPLARDLLTRGGYLVDAPVVVPDGAEEVERAIRAALADGARIVLTTGGTGVGPRDLTPEGTRPVIARELPGVAEALRRHGEASVATAVLSRGLAGVTTDGAVVVNLPGSTGGVAQGVEVLLPLLGHLLDQTAGGDHG